MSARIVPYSHLANDPDILSQLKEIFFESSNRKEFATDLEREHFYEKYLGWYLRRYPEYLWLAYDKHVLGYMAMAPISVDSELDELQPHLKIFRSHFDKFPAHLHINCHRDSRGQGIGAQLIESGENQLRSLQIAGLHILTSSNARNRFFYSRLGFDYQALLPFNGGEILMMSKIL